MREEMKLAGCVAEKGESNGNREPTDMKGKCYNAWMKEELSW